MGWRWQRNYRRRSAMLAEPPQNGEYLVAAYLVATAILLAYWLQLWRQARTLRAKREPKK
jgi:hypothetical protein